MAPSNELEDFVELISRHWPQPHPWKAERGLLCFEPMWGSGFATERSDHAGGLRELAGRFGVKPSLDFAWGALMGRAPERLALPLDMDEVKERCDAGELLVALAREGTPRVCRLAAFPEVYEVDLELPDGRREKRPWSQWAAQLEALMSLK